MLIRLGYDLTFEIPAPTPMVLMLHVHPERTRDLVEPEKLHIEPSVPVEDFLDTFGNHCGRILAPAGRIQMRYEGLIRDDGFNDAQNPNARQHGIAELPSDALQFLFSSRYCEVDKLGPIAWELFGKTEPGWPRVKAVCNWVQDNIRFGYRFARLTKTAWDVFVERTGVCRDYMHLAIAFCRCLNIPARYATGYLGDIGVPDTPDPGDFSAYFEVFLENRWWSMDARHNVPRLGRILMARGRDATDVALTTSFGVTKLVQFKVITEEEKRG